MEILISPRLVRPQNWFAVQDNLQTRSPVPHALDIALRLNGELLQNSNTRELLFKIPALIAYVSALVRCGRVM